MEVSGQIQVMTVFLPGKVDDSDITFNNIHNSSTDSDKCTTLFGNPGCWLQN